MIQLTIANGFRQKPKDYDFALLPNIIISRPPDSVEVINRSKSFAIALNWGYWAVIIWFIKTN